LSDPKNPLPKKLKEDLLSLSAFIDTRIFDILSFPSPEKLNAIINININIAAGLRGSAVQK
jgi:flagellar protein FlaF